MVHSSFFFSISVDILSLFLSFLTYYSRNLKGRNFLVVKVTLTMFSSQLYIQYLLNNATFSIKSLNHEYRTLFFNKRQCYDAKEIAKSIIFHKTTCKICEIIELNIQQHTTQKLERCVISVIPQSYSLWNIYIYIYIYI